MQRDTSVAGVKILIAISPQVEEVLEAWRMYLGERSRNATIRRLFGFLGKVDKGLLAPPLPVITHPYRVSSCQPCAEGRHEDCGNGSVEVMEGIPMRMVCLCGACAADRTEVNASV